MYIAHKTGDEREQPLKAHLSAVAESCRTVGLGIGLPITFYLVGLLHDMGKYSREFQDYIRKALPALRGTVNHLSLIHIFGCADFGFGHFLAIGKAAGKGDDCQNHR